MKYFFALGNNSTLSVAELSAVFDMKNPILLDDVLICEINRFDADKAIRRLGGTIKIGEIFYEAKHTNEKNILENINEILPYNFEGKFKFGVSLYGKSKLKIKQIGMKIKNILKERNISCRWVAGKEKALSSVIVEQNKLTSRGIEICIIKNQNQTFIGKTLTVQPFKELSHRDFGRPARDDRSGMLPPKLAQIMINLANHSTFHGTFHSTFHSTFHRICLLDPFCGSGTVLTEAMLMGFQNLIGSDISEKAIKDTEKNIQYIIRNWKIEIGKLKLENTSATEISKKIKPNSIDAIVTEPYLGPQRGNVDIQKTKKELERLYSAALREFAKVLKKDGTVVMLWPIRATHNAQCITPDINNFKIINPVAKKLLHNKNIKLTDRNTIVYGREGQKVWREIVVMRKK